MTLRGAVLVLVLLGTHVVAQPADPRRRDAGYIGKDIPVLEIDDCPAQPPGDADRLRQIGFEHFERGDTLYKQGDYLGAVKELSAAYCIYPYWTILKDVGEAYERELEYAKAIAYYERFVVAVPKDAKPMVACDPDPQIQKQSVASRIEVLRRLKAKLRVDTEPGDATVTLSNEVTAGRATNSGEQIDVDGGSYDMTIQRPGFHPITRKIVLEIGKPYTMFERLEPVKGRLRVRIVPADAKVYLDRKPVGSGTLDTELPNGRYTLLAEAHDRISTSREIEVLPDRDTNVAFELPPNPEYGRKQLLAYGSVAAGVASGLMAGAQTNQFYDTLAVGGGLVGGLLGIYFGTPEDLPLGTSSLTITSSLVGAGAAAALAATRTDDGNTAAPIVGAGLVIGAGVGYYVGRRTNLSAGDAAIINSGALWGAVAAGLLAVSFNGGGDYNGGIVLTGLAMGTTGGVLLQRYATVSRGHAALIDASGVLGVVGGLATLSLVNRTKSATATSSDERTSNYALGGLVTGLIVGGVLTRNIDEPKITVTPAIGHTTSGSTTLGIGGSF